MRERSVEGSAVKWARPRGWWAAKFKSPAHRGRPDHLFAKVCPSGFRPIAVEFKKRGKKSKGLQAVIIKQMEDAGWEVYKDVDTLDKFKALILTIENQDVRPPPPRKCKKCADTGRMLSNDGREEEDCDCRQSANAAALRMFTAEAEKVRVNNEAVNRILNRRSC